MGTYSESRIKGIGRIGLSMRQTWIVGLFLVLSPVFLSSCCRETPTESSATFVQIPDIHLFDDSKRQPGLKLWEQDEQAFDWAIEEITKIKGLKFVVFTGDLGLEMTGPYWESQAVDFFVTKLSDLPVDYILFVPGNNDLLNEEPMDTVRYQHFVTELGNKMKSKKKVKDLSQQSIDIGNMRIHGLNSATFKNSIPCRLGFDSLPTCVPAGWTVIKFPTLPVQYLWCKDDDIKSRLNHQRDEMCRLANEVNDKPEKVHLIFTHIPPLTDPVSGHVEPLPSRDVEPQPWNLDTLTFGMWKNHIMPNVKCVFAAHFHTDNRAHYGINGLLKGRCDKEIVVVPPLAIKFQDDVKKVPVPARGFLKGTVENDTVSYEIVWYPGKIKK